MAHSLPRSLDDCRREEETLSRLVTDDDDNNSLKFQQIEESLSRHRALCSNVLLVDFNMATGPSFRAEDRLWDNHQKVNGVFRSRLASLRKSSEPRPVELRKLGHEYLKFIKSSQSFYRNLIKRLDKAYGGIASLHRVAKRLHPKDFGSVTEGTSAQHPLAPQLETCCHSILIRLGDLSRYRESELAGSEKNWGPAHGYYDLALTVCPGSGIPYNQRAVIALADKTLFRALYYVYRSISAQNPYPQGEQNLRRALQKIQHAWTSKELTMDPLATTGAALPKGLVAWYLRLLEMFFHGKAASEKDELETEVITQLKTDLQQYPSKESPRKLVVTGLAAQHTAQERFELNQSTINQNSYLLFLQLNVQIFSALLSVFVAEAGSIAVPGSSHEFAESGSPGPFSPLLQRILPTLRLYSIWLENTCNIVNSSVSGIPVALKSEFWINYAKTLSVMISRFEPESLPEIPHMLEEDEDTIGFKPLLSPRNTQVWFENATLKPRWYECSSGLERNIEKEMKFRIREFTLQGFELSLAKRAPINFEKEKRTFSYEIEAAQQEATFVAPKPLDEVSTEASLSEHANGQALRQAEINNALPVEEGTQDEEAEKMVESIVGGKSGQNSLFPDEGLSADRIREASSPRKSASRGSGSGVSPLPVGTQTVNDIMATLHRKSQPLSPALQPLEMQRSHSGSRPSSSVHSPATNQQQLQLQHTPDASLGGIQNSTPRQYPFPEDPALPGLGVIKETRAPVASFGPSSPQPNRASPLPPPLSRSRVNSSESSRGIWGAGIFDPSYHRNEERTEWQGVRDGQFVSTVPSSHVPFSSTGEHGSSNLVQDIHNVPWNHVLQQDRNGSNVNPLASTNVMDRQNSTSEHDNTRSAAYRNPWNGLK